MNNNTKKLLCSIGVVLAALVLLLPFGYTLLLSFTDYRIVRGLLGSPWVGFENVSRFFESPHFMNILLNTVIISILGTLIGAVYTFLSSLAIGSGKHPVLKGVLATVFAIPALIPINLFLSIFPKEFLANPSFALRLAVSFVDGLRMAGLVVIAGFFIKGDVLKESLKCALLFVSIRLISFLTTDTITILNVYNPNTYEILDVFSSHTYRVGLLETNYSYSAAVAVAKVILQFIPAVIGCVILALICKDKRENEIPSSSSFLPAAIAAIIPVALLVTVIITGGSLLPDLFHEMVITGYVREFLAAFISALLVAVIAVLLAIGARNSGVVGIIVLTVLCLTGKSLIGEFLIIRSVGIYNTLLGVILSNLHMFAPLALILAFATYRNRSMASNISAFVIAFVVMFAWFWGDWLSPVIMIKDRALYPLSLVLRELSMGMSSPMVRFIPLSTAPYILIPVIVGGIGFIVSGIIKMIVKPKNV